MKIYSYTNEQIDDDKYERSGHIYSKEITEFGDRLRAKRQAGINDAKKYMDLPGSSFTINYRPYYRYMFNKMDDGNGVNIRGNIVQELIQYIQSIGYTRERVSEYGFMYTRDD